MKTKKKKNPTAEIRKFAFDNYLTIKRFMLIQNYVFYFCADVQYYIIK